MSSVEYISILLIFISNYGNTCILSCDHNITTYVYFKTSSLGHSPFLDQGGSCLNVFFKKAQISMFLFILLKGGYVKSICCEEPTSRN